ncbi:hypothetical protein G9P44_006196 [Scheffersomyces stipitis]|nr:hypothetical protein G9P44_006196 [Scheffersomyces stipitis]
MASVVINATKIRPLFLVLERQKWTSISSFRSISVCTRNSRNSRYNSTSNSNYSRRHYSNGQYSYQYNQPYNAGTTIWRKLLYVGVGFVALTGYGYYMFWPKHTFPKSVAAILRKGLWAESEKGENDYQLALKYYLEALEHCNEIGMDTLSDEYTGIQLKVGEMFERLNMPQDAAFVYNEIATLYLMVLTATPESEQGRRINDREHRRHLIQKDLRIATKLVELNRDNPQLCRAILITHLIIAQDEVRKQSPSSASQLAKLTSPDEVHTTDNYKATVHDDSIVIRNGDVVTSFKKSPELWEPFAEEYFNAMDLLGAFCISLGDLSMASKVKISMTESMLLADVEPHKILLSQCNLGSLLYLQAEEFQAQEIAWRRKFSQQSGIEYEKIKSEELLNNLSNSEQVQKELEKAIPAADKIKYEESIASKDKCLQLSIKSYESVLEFAKGLPQEIVKGNTAVGEGVALATYGLGVVYLHLSQYDKAERLLRESRVRSKNCGYDELITQIERELNKLFKEKKNLKIADPKNPAPTDEDIEIDILLKKT